MKKIISMLGLACIGLLMAACQSGSGNMEALNKAVKESNTEQVAKLSAESYAQIADCSAEELANLTIAYSYLAEKEMEGRNDPAYLSEFIEKALECYDKAVAADKEAAEEVFKTAGKENIKEVVTGLKTQLEEAQAAEQALLEQING